MTSTADTVSVTVEIGNIRYQKRGAVYATFSAILDVAGVEMTIHGCSARNDGILLIC